MKVKLWSELPLETIGCSEIKGKCLVSETDCDHFRIYEQRFNAGQTVQVTSPFGNGWNHIYYVLKAAKLIFECSDGGLFETKTASVVAMTGSISANIKVGQENCRLYVIYIPQATDMPQPKKAVCRSLCELIGTERDVDWQHGRSRRFLRRDDGFNISIHNTINNAEAISPIHYKNQFEAVYWIGGRGRFTWGGENCDQNEQDFDYSTEEKQGDSTMMVVGNTSHIVYSYEPGPVSLAVFYPPLKGTETHDFTKGVSSYE